MEGTSTCPQLPLEIWTEIIASACRVNPDTTSHTGTLGQTWVTCRLVSKTLKAATESAFRRVLRNEVVINIYHPLDQDGRYPWTIGAGSFSDDGEYAIMDMQNYTTPPEDPERRDSFRAWLEPAIFGFKSGKPCSCRITTSPTPDQVIFGKKIELPELKPDYDNLTISFDWKRLFSLSFGRWEKADRVAKSIYDRFGGRGTLGTR